VGTVREKSLPGSTVTDSREQSACVEAAGRSDAQ
jgi:hypothetical protein